MCGVVAIHAPRGSVACAQLRSGMDALSHRGPDGEGLFVPSHGRIGLGHRRLSVIDLETGAQPISNEDGSLTIVANGEFYGFEEIRRELEAGGHRFRTRSDTEIAVHLYEDLGPRCLERLRGEFAFVIWDERSQSVFAARDRFGVKPLFYAEHAGSLHLASEAKALFASGVPARWNHESVYRALFLALGQDRSLFDGVRQIPPGHYLKASSTGVRLSRYWDSEYPTAGDRAGHLRDPQACIEEVRRLLGRSVSLRMRSDVPVGCLLSGGLDSSSVLGFASREATSTMRAFTIAFDNPSFDESSLARETAGFLGADFHAVDASEHHLADNFADSVTQGEIIVYNAHGTARFLLSRAIQRAGIKVVLAGEGADELFAGYGFSSAALASRARGSLRGKLDMVARLLGPATDSEKIIRRTSPWLMRMSRILDLSKGVTEPLGKRMSAMQSILSPEFMGSIPNADPYRTLFRELAPMNRIRGREPAKQIIYLWMKTLFPAYVLAADRADMAHGVEVRLPFLDHVLFDYVRSIPVALLFRNGERKHVLREAASGVLSEAVRNRPKKPLMAPPFTPGSRSPLDRMIQDTLRSADATAVPFFEPHALRSLLDEPYSSTKATTDPLLLMAASLSVLQQRYKLS